MRNLREVCADMALSIYYKTSKGGKDMMAMLFAQRIILGKITFEEVPAKLKAQVAEILIDSGLPNLVPAEYGGTAA